MRRMALSKGALSALKKRTAAVQENDIRRRSSMQLEERPTFLCAMTNREVVCPYALFFFFFFSTTTVRCVASVCRAKQQVQVASKEGASRKEIFSNTEQGGAKSNRKQNKTKQKKGTEPQEKSTHTTSNKIQNTNISPIYT